MFIIKFKIKFFILLIFFIITLSLKSIVNSRINIFRYYYKILKFNNNN